MDKTPIGAILHYKHFILFYEDERKVRSYLLIDANANKIAEYNETKQGDKVIPADLAAAMKYAKRREAAETATAALQALDEVSPE